MFQIRIASLILIAALTLLPACTKLAGFTSTGQEFSLFHPSACLEGICPGSVITPEEAMGLLTRNRTLNTVRQGEQLIGFSIIDSNANVTGYGGIYFDSFASDEEMVVKRISLHIDHLTLATALELFGEPDQYAFIAGCGMGYRVHAKLIYSNEGIEIVIDHNSSQPEQERLNGKTPISSVEYFVPHEFQHHVQETLDWYIFDSAGYDVPELVAPEDIVAQFQLWHGVEAATFPTLNICPRSRY